VRRILRVSMVLSLVVSSLYLAGLLWPVEAHVDAIQQVPLPGVEVSLREHWVFPRVSYYNAVPEQTDDDPFTSACGPNLPNQVAVSRDLFRKELHCGDVLDVWVGGEYHGRFVVWDTTHLRFRGTLDILTETKYAWGLSNGHAVLVERGER
jgi:hypothetical protein